MYPLIIRSWERRQNGLSPLSGRFLSGVVTDCPDQDAFERKLFVIRKQVENAVRDLNLENGHSFYVPSLSTRTLVYKGMLLANQVGPFYPDLIDERMDSALALGASAFFHEYLPDLGSGSPIPYDRP